ncbi:DUF4198 domain-containing protein [Paenalkalicoccus suaedae]|uniref:DUF4198 domain-containing protein n=1 Tax=Paenalkalicoccus suaedae TaxID=2592382 RepID=A0A859FA54_9BACI|nr:DUF4198 domain-containing protein [Paenalkalicoccus suaedae]QKS69777.1 DUF4198 domain-containing protein [Paenalkalicoccus suaedae]
MRKRSAALLSALLISMTTPALAHEGWTQTHTPIVESGENVYVELFFGNHTNDHASFRIEGTWNADDTDVTVHTPSDEEVDISDTIFYMGESTELGNANNYHVASFAAIDSGIYTITAERDSLFGEKRTLRSAKSFAAIHDLPTFNGVLDLEGYENAVSPDRAEFIPMFNPTAVAADEEVEVQLVRQGEPVIGVDVSIVQRSTGEAQTAVTDEDGAARFTIGDADIYLVRATEELEEAGDGYATLAYEATMTFAAQNALNQGSEPVAEEEVEEEITQENEAIADASEEETASEVEFVEPEAPSLFSNGFFYLSLVLGLGLFGSTILYLRK